MTTKEIVEAHGNLMAIGATLEELAAGLIAAMTVIPPDWEQTVERMRSAYGKAVEEFESIDFRGVASK